MLFLGQKLEEALQARAFACAGRGAVLALTLQIVHIFVSVVEVDGFQKIQIDVVDPDKLKIRIGRQLTAMDFHEAEKRPQVQKILVDCFDGFLTDGLLIKKIFL